MRELLAARAQRLRKSSRLIGLTFDDGYDDFTDYALPVLLRYGFTATVFVLARRLGGVNEWDAGGPRKPLMTAARVRAAAAAGMEIGSHGLFHVSLPSVSGRELADEVSLSRHLLAEATGYAVDGFCYPFGHVSEDAVRAVRDAGYSYACAIWPNTWPAPYALARTPVQDPHLLTRLVSAGPRVVAESGPRAAARKLVQAMARRTG